jgi:hypothetical protein
MHHIDLSEHFKNAVEFFREQGKAIKQARKNIRGFLHQSSTWWSWSKFQDP